MEPIDHNANREARSSLEGYVYQVYATLLEWTYLKEDEYLFLEAAEDFDRAVPQGSYETVQVKHQASGSVTLRTAGVVDAVNNCWDHIQRNPGVPIRFRYLSTGLPPVL